MLLSGEMENKSNVAVLGENSLKLPQDSKVAYKYIY